MKPTIQEIKIARKVLKSYQKLSNKVATVTEQEYPEEVARGLEVWLDLLDGDPEEALKSYLEEYKASH